MRRVRIRPVKTSSVNIRAPGSLWGGLVAGLALLAAGGGVIERVPPQAKHLLSVIASRLGHVAEDLGDGLRLEYVGGRAGGEYSISVGCSIDYATLVGVIAGVIAPPGARIILRGCEELLEADWRPLVESVAAYGGKAYTTGSPRSLVIIEAVGRGRLRTGLWRLRVRSGSTVAHITAAIVTALAADDTVYINVWPRDPHSKSDIDPAVYAALAVSDVDYSPSYNRFRVKPGSGGARLANRPDFSLGLHVAGLSASRGVKVTLKAWSTEPSTPYDPFAIASILLDQLGYRYEARSDTITVEGVEEQVRRVYVLRDYPEYTPPLVTLAASRRGEVRVEEVPETYIQEANDVASLFIPLGYSLEIAKDVLSLKPAPQTLLLEELAATCTNPHVLPAALAASSLASRPYIVEHGDCLKHLWPEFYDDMAGVGAFEEI